MDPIVNFFNSSIQSLPVGINDTQIVLQAGAGAKLPNPTTEGSYNLTIVANGYTPEIVRVTGKTADTITVLRAQEGTVASEKVDGVNWSVIMVPTRKTFYDIYDALTDAGINEGNGSNFNLF